MYAYQPREIYEGVVNSTWRELWEETRGQLGTILYQANNPRPETPSGVMQRVKTDNPYW